MIARPGKGGEPPGGGDVVPPVREHPAPGRRGRLHAEPEEGQRRLVDDHERQLERGHHDDRGQRVRQDVAEQQAHRAVAARPGPAHELALADRQHVGADDARELHPAGDRHHQDHVEEARAEREDHAHREQDVGDGEEDVHHAHDERIGASPVEAGQEAEGDPDQAGQRHRGETDAERDPAPVEDAAQDVPPEVIGAERMLAQAALLPHGRPEALERASGAPGSQGRSAGRQRGAAHEEQHRDPEHGAEAHAAPARARPTGRRAATAAGLAASLIACSARRRSADRDRCRRGPSPG